MSAVEKLKARFTHTHKYARAKLGKQIIYRCMLPNCPHYIPKALARNRLSVCWRCGKEFVMNNYSLQLAFPHCRDCHTTKEGKPKEKPKKVDDFLNEILPKVAGE